MPRLLSDILIWLAIVAVGMFVLLCGIGCSSANAPDPKARTSETIGDARESNERSQVKAGKLHGTIEKLTPDGLTAMKPVALEQSNALREELKTTAGQLGVAAKTSARDEKIKEQDDKRAAEQNEKIKELESKSLSKSALNWLAVGCFAGGVGCIIAFVFIRRAALLACAGALIAAGAMFTFIAQYLDMIALAAGIALLFAVAVGVWLAWKWLKDRNTGAKIIQSFQVAKAAGKLTISPDAVPILDAVQGEDGKAFVDEVQKKGSQ